MDRAKKAETIEQLRKKFSQAGSIVVFDYKGMTVGEVTGLRREFRKNSVECRVVKNTLARIALKGTAYEGVSKFLRNTTAIAMAKEDPTQSARVAVGFARSNEKLKIRAGALPGSVLNAEDVKALAALPSKDEMRAKMLSLLVTPQRNFLYVLKAAQSGLLTVLAGYAESKEKAAA